MWKIISVLAALLIVSHTAKIEDFYGDWYEAGFYPIEVFVPRCRRFTLLSAENQCTCDDGSSNAFYMSSTIAHRNLVPVVVVDSPTEVMPAFSVMCRCGDKKFTDHPVARLVNGEYFFLYHTVFQHTYNSTEIEPNGAFIFSRKIVSENTLANATISNDDLKKRQGAFLCTTEYIEENNIDPKTIV